MALSASEPPRGMLWDRGMVSLTLDGLYRVTGDPSIARCMQTEWTRIKRLFTPEELEDAGGRLHFACDDTGWNAMLYLVLYRRCKRSRGPPTGQGTAGTWLPVLARRRAGRRAVVQRPAENQIALRRGPGDRRPRRGGSHRRRGHEGQGPPLLRVDGSAFAPPGRRVLYWAVSAAATGLWARTVPTRSPNAAA